MKIRFVIIIWLALVNCAVGQDGVRCDEYSISYSEFSPIGAVRRPISPWRPGIRASWVYYKTDSCGAQLRKSHLLAVLGFDRYDYYFDDPVYFNILLVNEK